MIFKFPVGRRQKCGDRKLGVAGSKLGTGTLVSFINRLKQGRILKLCMRFMSKIKLSKTLGKSKQKQPITSAKFIQQIQSPIQKMKLWI